MKTLRQNKICRMLQKEISEMFQREGKQYIISGLVSVTTVRISPDLSVAKVYLSIFATEQIPAVINNIQVNAKTIRHILSQRIRYQIRRVPELIFYHDDSVDYIEKIDKLLKK